MSAAVWRVVVLLIGGLNLSCDVTARRHQQTAASKMTSDFHCPGDDVTEVFVVINARGLVAGDGSPLWRRLELIWHTAKVSDTDQVSLYDSDPEATSDATPMLTIQPASFPDGYFTSNISVAVFNFTDEAPVSRCLGFYARYRRDGVAIAAGCLASRPDWMFAAAADLQDVHLHELMLPGAHDAASYRDYHGASTDYNLFQRYASAQEETLLSQFYLGVRYFDARVAYYPLATEPFWVSHGVVPFRPFSGVVDDLVQMLNRTREVVVFEIGGFEGAFSRHPEAYQQLLDVLEPRLEQWMAPLPAGRLHHVLLADLWASDRRLVLCWDADPGQNNALWPRVPNTWHNDDTPQALYDTLNRSMAAAPRAQLWALAAEMTDHASDVIFDRLTSLRDMADTVNRNVSRMVRYDWWDLTNIVQSDFFMSSYHADTAVLVNWQRTHCP